MRGLRPTYERADERTRTADPFITSEVLYQLSYVGEADGTLVQTARVLAVVPRDEALGLEAREPEAVAVVVTALEGRHATRAAEGA